MDISASGVSLKTDVRPAIGEFVLIAQMAGRIARHHEQGIGIEFVGQEKTQNAEPAARLIWFADFSPSLGAYSNLERLLRPALSHHALRATGVRL